MDPVLIAGGVVALYFLFRGKKGKKKTTPSVGPPVRPGEDPTGPFGPFEPPPFEPPPQPTGPGDDPAPIPVPTDIDPSEIEDLGPHALAISQDCQDVYEGLQWYPIIFLPAVKSLVALNPERFSHPWIMMQALLTFTGPDEECIEDETGQVDCSPVLEPECIANWTYFISVDLDVPGGPWDSSTNAGYAAFLQYADWYESNYRSVNDFLIALENRLWMDPELGPHWAAHAEAGTDIVFIPPSAPEPEPEAA